MVLLAQRRRCCPLPEPAQSRGGRPARRRPGRDARLLLLPPARGQPPSRTARSGSTCRRCVDALRPELPGLVIEHVAGCAVADGELGDSRCRRRGQPRGRLRRGARRPRRALRARHLRRGLRRRGPEAARRPDRSAGRAARHRGPRGPRPDGRAAVRSRGVRGPAAAVVQAFFPGEEGGPAVAGVLSGRVCPSGRLPVSVPRGPGGQPTTYLAPPLGRRTEISSLDPTPLYPFGHGLSYTEFQWEDVRAAGQPVGQLDGGRQPAAAQPDGGASPQPAAGRGPHGRLVHCGTDRPQRR